MAAAELGLAVSVFLACAVEAVEALTIVMAVGYARSWPSALGGAAAAALVLTAAVATVGSALKSVPIDTLRLVIGALLLAFGVQWLRKAILRAAGRKRLRDERAAYERERAAAAQAGAPREGFDLYSFAISLKGVLLEGLEVALIVVTLGAARHRLTLAAVAAAAAVAAVIAAGLAARAPLARVPENTMKFAVGVMLSAYGTFWVAEGAGLSWPAGDAALIGLVAVVLAGSLLAVAAVRRLGGVAEAG
jgi:uncharacterized membrane protein